MDTLQAVIFNVVIDIHNLTFCVYFLKGHLFSKDFTIPLPMWN